MRKVLEIACFNLESVILAQADGADRIELCENYKEGGITPSNELIIEAREKCSLPLHVIIRPRGGNFIYSISEIEQMRESILFCKHHNINGIVFGALNANSEIDENICKELIALAKPMSVTFHRAIDNCKDQKKEVAKLIGLGCDRILSSGTEINALEGAYNLRELQLEFGDKIIIMPGGGIRSGNFQDIMSITQCNEFHTAAMAAGHDFLCELTIKHLKKILSEC